MLRLITRGGIVVSGVTAGIVMRRLNGDVLTALRIANDLALKGRRHQGREGGASYEDAASETMHHDGPETLRPTVATPGHAGKVLIGLP